MVFAGTRIDQGSKYIKQLAEATGAPPDKRADLEDILQQTGIITGVRNDILHYGATSVAEGRAVVSNALKAKGEPTEFPVSPTVLDNMTADLRKIATHLNYKHLGRPMPRGALGQGLIWRAFESPWQYKHPSPPKTPPKKDEARPAPKRDPKQPPPPPSSQG